MSLVALSQIWMEPRADSYPVALREGKVITFSQFRADVGGVASRLKNCRRAVLACSDSYYFLIGIYALLQVGAVIILPANSQPATLGKLRSLYDLCVEDDFIAMPVQTSVSLSALDPLRPAFEFFTSGSSGEPKAISKNLRMLEYEIAGLDALLGSNLGKGTVFATVAHQHLYGLIFKLFWPLASGRVFSTRTHAFWETLLPEITAGAIVISSPAHLGRLAGIEPLPPMSRPTNVFSAGAILPFAASMQSEAIFGCTPTEIFGSTETGAIAMRHQEKVDQAWQLLPGIAMECDAENRMVLHSPSICPEAFTTADRIEPLANGFHFLGRSDRIAKIEGKRINLIEVENALLQLNDVRAAAVLALPGNSTQLAAALVLSPEGVELLAKMGKFRFGRQLRQALALTQEPMAIPRLWRFVESLPMRDLGKICEAELLTLFGDGT